jgi:RNA polymerase sigma factor (sigma-70 family)
MATQQLRQIIQGLRSSTVPAEGDGSDGQLLASYVRDRDETAFAALVHRHGPMVWGVCCRVLESRQDAEDAFQATFLVLVRKAASVAKVGNWLYGVAHRTALKARTTAARRRAREKPVAAMVEPAQPEPEPAQDWRDVLDQELARLPLKYRDVLVACDLDGKTRKEAAQLFRLAEGTVASRLATARTMLAKRLARQGVALSTATLTALLAENLANAAVPASLAGPTMEAARLFAVGQATAGGALSLQAIVLAERVLKNMLLVRRLISVGLLVGVAILGTTGAVYLQQMPREKEPQPPAIVRADSNDVIAEWPQWRGPNRDGVVHGARVPAAWPKALQQEWSIPVGEGVASPVLAHGNIFVFARQNDREILLCLDVRDGREIWRSVPYPAPYKVSAEERNFSIGPRSTPAVVAGRVYTLGMSGLLSCLDARSGTHLWAQQCKPRDVTLPPGTAHDYGGSSPLVVDGLCVVHAGDGTKGGLAAFDAITGEPRWCFSEGYRPMSGSPILVDLAGTRQVVTYASSNAAGVSTATGARLWWLGSDGVGQPHTTPVLYKDLIILNDILQAPRALRLERDGQGIAVRQVWQAKGTPLACCSPVLVGDQVIGMSSRLGGSFFCLDARTGTTLWESPGREGDHASIMRAGNVLLILTEKGRLIIVKPSATAYEPIAEYQVSDTDTYAHPLFLGERILIRDAATLRSFRIGEDAGNPSEK